VIIFDSRQANYDTLFMGRGAEMIVQSPILTFKTNKNNTLYPLYKIIQDTLSLDMNSNDWVIIEYRFNPMSSYTLLMNKGDTLLIKHENGLPVLALKNRNSKPFDINYEYFRRQRYELINGYSLLDHYHQPSYLQHVSIVKKLLYNEVVKDIHTKLYQELQDEQLWLDSLTHENLISENLSKYFSDRNKYLVSGMTLSKESFPKDKMKNILKEYNDSLFINDIFGFYWNYYYQTANQYYADKKLTNANGFEVDYKAAYDQLENNSLVYGQLRKHLKLNWLHGIIAQQPMTVAKTYYEKQLQEISDTVITHSLQRMYGEMFDSSIMESVALELMSKDGKTIAFEEFLIQNKGKLLYVDFWASWCGPCLAEMSHAKKLRNEYANQDIVFVYLALSDKKDAWLSTLNKAGLSDEPNSFFILNSQTAPLIKKLHIRTIPRYLLYDKTGKLMHSNAPRPSSEEIRKIFDKEK
jgi:thiol-disulfide isomerase/thioredoxin